MLVCVVREESQMNAEAHCFAYEHAIARLDLLLLPNMLVSIVRGAASVRRIM